MKAVAIIQARMGSSRLPGKVLMKLGRKPVLEHVVNRVTRAGVFSEVVIATTERTIDDPISEFGDTVGCRVVRGSENNVLSRFGLAAELSNAEAIMRVTADCPIIDPTVLAKMMAVFRESGADMVTNARVRTFPRGLDAELFTRNALEAMLSAAKAPEEREHVTPFIYSHPDRFHIVDYLADQDRSDWRLTLDTREDFELLTRLAGEVEEFGHITIEQIEQIFDQKPQWQMINAHIEQKKIGGE